MSDTLVVGLGGIVAGTLVATTGGIRLEYDEAYRRRSDATPLSLALPLSSRTHPPTRTERWLDGLLPDDLDVRRRWARQLEVPARPFALLGSPIGEDCAGAVQIAPPDRVDQVLARPGRVRWLDDEAVAARLDDLRSDRTAWLGAGFTGQFSLAGAQAKTALHRRGERWGDPTGATPTTHILKPAIAGLDDHDLNEHLCMQAAARLGLLVARTEVARFGGASALVVERYDRIERDGRVRRVHQEDLCQALGLDPTEKYQFEGGPAPADIVALFRSTMAPSVADDAVWRFVDALAWSWIIAATDAHARNYSVLLAGPQVRLAPLYDIASALPYDGVDPPKLKLAMKLGGEYRLKAHRGRTWIKVAEELALDADRVVARVGDLVDATPDALADAAAAPAVTALGSPLPRRLVDAVAGRVEECRRLLPG